jgi:hypothetical protein
MGLAVYEMRQNAALTAKNRELQRQSAAEATALREQIEALSAQKGTWEGDSKRLSDLQSELARLRAEVATLRQRHAQATNAVAKTEARESKPEFPVPVLKHFGKTSSPMKPGETLITGGWPSESANGGRSFIVLTLQQPGPDSAQYLTFRGSVVDLPDSLITAIGVQNFGPDNDGTTPSSLLDMDESAARDWVEQLRSTDGVQVLASPTVVTEPGKEAKIFIGQSVPIADGKYAQVGRTITISPQWSEQGIQVSLNSELTGLPGAR